MYLVNMKHRYPYKWTLKDAVFTKDKGSVLEKAQKTTPSYIRSFNLNVEINKDLGKILEQIPDFSYSVSKGFFHWQYAQGLESGTLPYSIETQDFDKFQKLVIEKKPSSFDDLEVFLI